MLFPNYHFQIVIHKLLILMSFILRLLVLKMLFVNYYFVNALGVKKELDHLKPLPKDIFITFVKSQYEDKSSDAKKKLKISL